MDKIKIDMPSDIVKLFSRYAKKRQEHFLCATLNNAHEVIKTHVVTIGLVNRTIVHPREIFYHAIKDYAVAIVVAHNHPTGSLVPSSEDKEITERLCHAGELLGIHVLDHLILAGDGDYFSFRTHNGMEYDFSDADHASFVKQVNGGK